MRKSRLFGQNLVPILMFGLMAPAVALAGGAHDSGHQATSDVPVDRTIRFEAGDMWFIPGSLDVAPGETIRFEIQNSGDLEHEFVIGDAEAQEAHRQMMQEMVSGGHGSHGAHGGHGSQGHGNQGDAAGSAMSDMAAVTIAPGETATLVWTAPEDVRDLEFACNIPGHYEAGMAGDIDVEG